MVGIEQIPILRWKRRLGRFYKRFRLWILILLGAIVVGFLATPIKIVWDIIKGIAALLWPVLDNPVGRVVFTTIVLAIVAWIVWWRFSARLRSLVGFHALDRFLDGVNHMVMGRHRAGIACFEAVIKRSKLVDLETAMPAYPDMLDAARIKLAECHRLEGDLDQALRWIESVREKALPADLKRVLGEIRALVYDAHPDLREEVRHDEVQTAAEADASNARLLRVLRERADGKENLAEAIRVQKKLVRATPRAERSKARRDLAVLHYRRARAAEDDGNRDEAERAYRTAAKLDGFDLPWLRLGDMALADEDLHGALDAWAKGPVLPALDRIRSLLAEGRLRDDADRALILQRFPYGETLLVFAERFLEDGDTKRARNALAKLESLGLAGPAVDRLAAGISRKEGRPEEAARRDVAALRSFLTDGRL